MSLVAAGLTSAIRNGDYCDSFLKVIKGNKKSQNLDSGMLNCLML